MAAAKSGPNPLQKSLSRRVSFKEDTLATAQNSIRKPPSYDSDAESQTGSFGSRSRCGCTALFSSCCACISIIIGVTIFLCLLAGGIYYAILQSTLPEVQIHRLDVYKLNVTNSGGNTKLTSDIEIRLNTTNGNGKVGLGYSSLTATLMAEGVKLGSVKLPAMTQRPSTTMDLKVRLGLNRETVEEAAASELMDKSDHHSMVIDAVVKGHIDFFLGSKKFSGFSFKVNCHGIDQTEIDNGKSPKCNSKMTL